MGIPEAGHGHGHDEPVGIAGQQSVEGRLKRVQSFLHYLVGILRSAKLDV
jgi:hypothetical protein